MRIVEHVDATAAERRIREVVLLAFAFRREDLFRALPTLSKENRQGEYYLTDLPSRLVSAGERVSVVTVDTGGAMGLNSRGGLASVAKVVRRRINETHMANGVTLIDPDTPYIDVGVRIGRDSVIRPNTFLEGDTSVGTGCEIGPSVRASDSSIGDGCRVQPLMDRNFAAVQKTVRDDPALRGRVHLLSVSFDPEYDTPEILKKHAALRGADSSVWSYVTAARDEIDVFAARFGMSIVRGATSGDFDHTMRTAVTDRHGRLATLYVGNEWSPNELVRALRVAAAKP